MLAMMLADQLLATVLDTKQRRAKRESLQKLREALISVFVASSGNSFAKSSPESQPQSGLSDHMAFDCWLLQPTELQTVKCRFWGLHGRWTQGLWLCGLQQRLIQGCVGDCGAAASIPITWPPREAHAVVSFR